MAAENNDWVRIAGTGEVPEGSVIAVKVGDREIALYHLDGGEFRATDNFCTHGAARLSEGFLDDNEIECPLHFGRFNVRTGEHLCPPLVKDIEVFEVAVRGSEVLVKLSK